MESKNVLLTERKKTEFFTDVLAQDMNRLFLFILVDGQQKNSRPAQNETRHSLH
jgi:hypothetical protein